MSDAGQITVELVAKIDQLNSQLGEAVNTIRNSTGQMRQSFEHGSEGVRLFGDNMNDLRHTMLGLIDPIRGVYSGVGELAEVFAAAFAIEKIAEFAEKMSELGADALHSAAEIGLSTEEITRFNFAAGAMGLQGEAGAQGLMRLERAASAAAGGEKTYAEAFEALGIKVTDAHGKVKSMSELLPEVANRFAATADGPNKTALAMEIMGRAGARMIPLLDQGASGMKEMSDAASAAGVTISGPMAEGMEKTAISIYDLGRSVGGVAVPLYEAFKPAIDVVVDLLSGLVQGFNNNIKSGGQFNQALEIVVLVVDAVVAAILTLVTGFEQLYDIIEAGAIAVIGPLEVLGKVISDVFSGHWAQAEADTKVGLETVGRLVEDKLKDILVKGQQYKEELGKLFSNIGPNGVDTTGGKEGPKGPKKPDLPATDYGAGDEARKLADERLKASEQEALEEIKIEQDKNNHLLAMGQETVEQYVATAEQLESRIYEVKLAYLQKKVAVDRGNALEEAKDQDAMALLAIQHEEALNRIAQQGEEKRAALHRQEVQEAIQADNDRLANAREELDHEYNMHLLSVEEKAAAERKLTITIYDQELARLDAELATLTKGTEAWNAVYKQRQKIAEDMAKSVQKIDNQLAEEQMQKWMQLASTIRQSFNSALNGMILGTTSWRQALGQIIDGVANAFLQMGEKILEDWIQTQITKALVTKSTDTTSALGQIQAAAGVAAANTFASTAAIPIVGPELAPAAAAGALSTVMSFSSLAFAEQGMLLDRDRLVFAHKDEQILPAYLSKGLQGLISDGGGRTGDVSLHYSPTLNSPEARSLHRMLVDESSTMLSWLNARMRDGSIKGR